MKFIEPKSPWFVNVTHMREAGRPVCSSPVDYSHAQWSADWSEVDCAACQRQNAMTDHGHNAEYDAGVRLTSEERHALLSWVPLAQGRDDDALVAFVEILVTRHRSEAWDEGLRFGQQHWTTNYAGVYENGSPLRDAPNPYRATSPGQTEGKPEW